MFTIQSIVMAQKLKGTLSFIAKVGTGQRPWPVLSPLSPGLQPLCPAPGCQATPQLQLPFSQDDEGATHEKLDFRLHFSCSSYLITTPCYRCVCLHPPEPPGGRWGVR